MGRSLSPKPTGRTMPYTPAYPSSYADPEKGLPTSPSSLARHILVPRKPKWILGGLLVCGAIFYYMNNNEDEKAWGHGGSWDAEGDGSRIDWEPSDDTSESPTYSDYIVDAHGNHFVKGWQQPITPMHPDVDLLPRAPSIFPYLNVSESELPEEKIFPDSDLRLIISQPPDLPEEHSNSMPEDAWSQKWTGPEIWDQPRGEMRRVQWDGFAGGRDRWESENDRKVREERKEAVKRGFKHAWEAYKRHAWGHDEVRPVSLTPSDPFNGWGATIVDSLDTMLLMGFSNEYNLCRPHVNQLNFHWVNGRDWSEGYVSEDLYGNGEVYALNRDKTVGLAVFETGIRYLGGLLGAYDLSGDDLLVERAVDLANILSTAFKTGSGLPAGRMDPGTKDEMIRLGTVSLAEVGSMSLELIRLSQITKDRKWFDLAQRAMDYIHERVIPRGTHSPLIPMWFQPDAPLTTSMNGGLTFGGLADSYYEYLVKTYKLLGASQVSQVWRDVYERSIDKAKETLYVDIDIVPGRDILAVGKLENGRLIPELEHLTCFIGAMLGLGAKLLDRPGDMRDAERVTASCYWLSADTPTGLQPEVVEWYAPHETSAMYENVSISGGGRHHPLIFSENESKNRDGMHRDRNGVLRWNEDNEPVLYANREKKKNEQTPIKYGQRLKGTPTGARKVSTRGLNRPETIESIFYMYRITGDRKWQEKGWKMFTSWMNTSTVDGGFSSVEDVTTSPVRFGDNMESFALAETFKYHFLLQSEPDVLSLDDYVLNTEAHPFLTNPKLDPKAHTSHTRFWSPSPSQDLGVRGQGTNAQKYARLEVIERASLPFLPPPPQNAPGGGGGRGMGGGGGKPGVIPKLPPEVLKNKVD